MIHEKTEWDKFAEHIKLAGESARRIGLMRGDRRWQLISQALQAIETKAMQVMSGRFHRG